MSGLHIHCCFVCVEVHGDSCICSLSLSDVHHAQRPIEVSAQLEFCLKVPAPSTGPAALPRHILGAGRETAEPLPLRKETSDRPPRPAQETFWRKLQDMWVEIQSEDASLHLGNHKFRPLSILPCPSDYSVLLSVVYRCNQFLCDMFCLESGYLFLYMTVAYRR